jgi:hypothetical protein
MLRPALLLRRLVAQDIAIANMEKRLDSFERQQRIRGGGEFEAEAPPSRGAAEQGAEPPGGPHPDAHRRHKSVLCRLDALELAAQRADGDAALVGADDGARGRGGNGGDAEAGDSDSDDSTGSSEHLRLEVNR